MKTGVHKNLGNVYISKQCEYLQKENEDITSIFVVVEETETIAEVTEELIEWDDPLKN